MSQEEQDEHYAKLLVEERRTRKKLACLASKCREINISLRLLLEPLERPLHANLPLTKERHAEFVTSHSETDIANLIQETIETVEHLETLRREIKEIENGISP